MDRAYRRATAAGWSFCDRRSGSVARRQRARTNGHPLSRVRRSPDRPLAARHRHARLERRVGAAAVDALDRRDVRVVAAVADLDVALAGEPAVGRVDADPARLAVRRPAAAPRSRRGCRPRPTRLRRRRAAVAVRRSCTGSPTRSARRCRARAAGSGRGARSPGRRRRARRARRSASSRRRSRPCGTRSGRGSARRRATRQSSGVGGGPRPRPAARPAADVPTASSVCSRNSPPASR